MLIHSTPHIQNGAVSILIWNIPHKSVGIRGLTMVENSPGFYQYLYFSNLIRFMKKI